MLSLFIASRKYSVPFDALYFVVLIFIFGLTCLLSLRAKPISLNLISFIFIFRFLISSSTSFLRSMFLIPQTKYCGGISRMIRMIRQYLGVSFNIWISISAVCSFV